MISSKECLKRIDERNYLTEREHKEFLKTIEQDLDRLEEFEKVLNGHCSKCVNRENNICVGMDAPIHIDTLINCIEMLSTELQMENQELKEENQKVKKALEIIKTKNVDVEGFKEALKSAIFLQLETYNNWVRYDKERMLVEEEFNSLIEVLK